MSGKQIKANADVNIVDEGLIGFTPSGRGLS
jgi:hypothetical protein